MSDIESTPELTDRLNLLVAQRFARRRKVDRDSAFSRALSRDPDPIDLLVYLTHLSAGWTRLFYGFGLFAVGLAFIGRHFDRTSGGMRGFALGMFLSVACLIGEIDARWRTVVADRASRPDVDPGKAAHLARIARSANSIGIVLQVLGGSLAAVFLWSIS